MKKGIHPDYHEIEVVMTDGTKFKTKSTWGKKGDVLNLDIDPKSHPAWSGGEKKLVDTQGQISKFSKRFKNYRSKKIEKTEKFYTAIKNGVNAASKGLMVTFGVMPSSPNTGYGYIRAGKKIENSILSFLELSRKLDAGGLSKDLINIVNNKTDAILSSSDNQCLLEELPDLIEKLEIKMKDAAKELNFEEAANLRDRIKKLRQKLARNN